MAIIIPSKNTYNTNNPKVRDNNVANVSVETLIVAPNNTYKEALFSRKCDLQNSYSRQPQTQIKVGEPTNAYLVLYAYGEARDKYFETRTVEVRKIYENKSATKIYYGVDNEGKSQIEYSLRYEKNTYDIECDFDNLGGSKTNATFTNIRRTSETPINTETIVGKLDAISLQDDGGNGFSLDDISISLTPLTNISTIVPDREDETGWYFPTLTILIGGNTKVFRYSTSSYGGVASIKTTLQGTEVEYVPKSLEITIYGDTISIDLTDSTKSYGSGGKPLTLSGNELLQDNTTTYRVPTTEYLANRVISEYANGKETATVLVSVSEYYDDNGNLVISTKKNDLPMTFRIGDLVIPMVYGADGVDRPMSRYKDGSPKVFRVVGRKPYFDGAVWQELSLQEFDKANLS